MELKILIVDDEPMIACYLRNIIAAVPGTRVVDVATSAREALQQAEIHKPQAVFLDIDLPQMNGLELARILQQRQKDIYIVFATAHPDFALQAFELYTFDYILKPFNEARIKKTVCKLREKINRPLADINAEHIFRMEYNGRAIFLKSADIIYIESRSPKRIFIKTVKNAYLIRGELNTIEQKLNPLGFFRCHRSYLVNLQQIKEIIPSGHTFEIVLHSGDKVLLSRQHEKILRESYGHYQVQSMSSG